MDEIYYINLESRPDRKEFLEKQMNEYNIKSNRINAVYNKTGSVGCGLSHIKTLQLCLELDYDYITILEDDFYIINKDYFKDFLKTFEKIKDSKLWDIIVLTPRGNTIKGDPTLNKLGFMRIINNQTATGYIIKKNMIPILIDCLKEGLKGLMKNGDPNIYANDQCWKKLQIDYNFYYYNNIFAGQLPGYSNIEKRHVNYNERFLQQNRY